MRSGQPWGVLGTEHQGKELSLIEPDVEKLHIFGKADVKMARAGG